MSEHILLFYSSGSVMCTWPILYQTHTTTKPFTYAVIHAMLPMNGKQILCIQKPSLGCIQERLVI